MLHKKSLKYPINSFVKNVTINAINKVSIINTT